MEIIILLVALFLFSLLSVAISCALLIVYADRIVPDISDPDPITLLGVVAPKKED